MPIGGFYFRPTGQFTVALGFPFLLVEWKDERTTLRLSSTLPSVEAVLERDFGDEFFYRFRTGLSERGYLHNDRIKDENRIFFEEKYLEGGTGLHLSSRTQAIFSLGYAFDRRVYEGTHIFDSSGPDRRIKNDLFGTLHLEFIL